jgi:cytoskeletal protein CcmA (bactofilin family)
MAKPAVQRTVQCYHCRHRFQVGTRTMTSSCPKCSKALRVEDVIVKTVEAVRKLQTCGRVVVTKKGRVIAQLVEAHDGVECEGIMEANVLSGGPVRIASKAHWKGDCKAPTISIELGSSIVSGYFVIPDDSLGLSDLPRHGTTP